MQFFLLEDCLWPTHRTAGNTCGLTNPRDFLKTFSPNGLLDIKSASRLFCAIRGRNSEDELGVGVNSGLFFTRYAVVTYPIRLSDLLQCCHPVFQVSIIYCG